MGGDGESSPAKEHHYGPTDRRTIAFMPEIMRNKNALFPEIKWRVTPCFWLITGDNLDYKEAGTSAGRQIRAAIKPPLYRKQLSSTIVVVLRQVGMDPVRLAAEVPAARDDQGLSG